MNEISNEEEDDLTLEQAAELVTYEMRQADAEELGRRVALADATPLEGDSWPNVRARILAGTAANAKLRKDA